MIRVRLVPALAALACVAVSGAVVAQTASPAPAEIVTVPGMPPVIDPTNLYSEIGPDRLSPAVRNDLARVYVPNRRSNTVTVIDQNTLAVVDTIKVGRNPQHV
ncbi:MAG: hypothetical protein JSR24_20300, partial [Proteobacteria bacterium]|nr:hypothetical protein [Pseudomonadota bacterium]